MTGGEGHFGSSAQGESGVNSTSDRADKDGSHPISTDVVDCIDLPILVLNRHCAIDSFNPAAAALLSLMPSDIGRSFRHIRMLTEVKNLEEACEHVLRGGASSRWEVRDGSGSWFSVRIGPCKAGNRTISGAVLTFTNVTALRASLEQAIREREYTKAIINTMIDPLVVLDEDLRVQAANQAFHGMFQASREEILGVRLHELGKCVWDISRLRALLDRARSTDGQLETAELDHELPALGRRTLLLNARRLSRKDLRHQTILVAIQDITDRKRAEEARGRLVEELQETLRYNEIFAGILAHDLRNPLAGILAAAKVLSRRHDGEVERVTRPISRILSSGERMARMIEQLLDFTQARSGGGISIEPRGVDLRVVAAQIVEELDGGAPQPIVFTATGNTCGEWDGDRLAQVLSNLLGNAVEHGEASRPIRLSVDGSELEVVRVTVSNAGLIPEWLLPNLFDPFRGATVAGRARKSKGLGLGLFITKQIVLAHGGTVTETSTAETGTTFDVRLPRRAVKGLQ